MYRQKNVLVVRIKIIVWIRVIRIVADRLEIRLFFVSSSVVNFKLPVSSSYVYVSLPVRCKFALELDQK